MIDPELRKDLKKLENELSQLNRATTGIWETLWRGCIYGAGYIIGAVIVIVIIGWVLNIVGVIPAFDRQVAEFRSALDNFSGPVK
jgi:hypothetical protein